MVIPIPKKYKVPGAVHYHNNPVDFINPGFVIHPPTSELAERLQVDPLSLANENYSGLYDESGDYIPQYCDDPEKVPQGEITANSEKDSVSLTGTKSLESSETDNNGDSSE